MTELLGPFPKTFATTGKKSLHYFNRKGELLNIKSLKYWSLGEILVQKYKFTEQQSFEYTSLILPMLTILPNRRITAQESLNNQWIKNIDINNLETAFE